MEPGGADPFDQFAQFQTLFTIVFVAIVVLALLRFVKFAAAEPRTARARCVTKRTRVSGGGPNTASSTRYYATFELADQQRVELSLNGRDYGQVAEGDEGTLHWKDTVFQGFERV